MRAQRQVLAPTSGAPRHSLPTPVRVTHAGRVQLVVVGVKSVEPRNDVRRPLGSHGSGPAAGVDAGFQETVDVMLNRAASSLRRGPCTCLQCRGGGAVECPLCKGAGRLGPEAAERAAALRTAMRRLRAAVGLASHVPYTSSDWVQTNRCMRCHGHGRLPCEPCFGSGLRFPYLSKDHWRQCAAQPGAECSGPDSACNVE